MKRNIVTTHNAQQADDLLNAAQKDHVLDCPPLSSQQWTVSIHTSFSIQNTITTSVTLESSSIRPHTQPKNPTIANYSMQWCRRPGSTAYVPLACPFE